MITVMFVWVLKFRNKFIGFKGKKKMKKFGGIWGNFVMNLGVMISGFHDPKPSVRMLWNMPSRSIFSDGFTGLFFLCLAAEKV